LLDLSCVLYSNLLHPTKEWEVQSRANERLAKWSNPAHCCAAAAAVATAAFASLTSVTLLLCVLPPYLHRRFTHDFAMCAAFR
jgi:hypothetical protein